jgi:putative hydrolases of HD superfamily
MLSFVMTDSTVNRDKLMKICLVHDLAEAIVGDITPYDGITKEEKRRMEEEALITMLNALEAESIAQEIYQLWLEYEEGTTIEAHLARQLDKLEMIIQANEYEKANPGKRLENFFTSTKESFEHPEIVGWASEVRKQHYERFKDIDSLQEKQVDKSDP